MKKTKIIDKLIKKRDKLDLKDDPSLREKINILDEKIAKYRGFSFEEIKKYEKHERLSKIEYKNKTRKINSLSKKIKRLEKKSLKCVDDIKREKISLKTASIKEKQELFRNNSCAEVKRLESMRISKERRKLILTGPLLKTVIAICMPIAIYNLFNSFYNVIDQVVCASISSSTVSSVATLSQVKNLISSIGVGLSGGGAIIVSRLYGAGDVAGAKKHATVLFTLALTVSCVIIIVMIPFAGPIIKAAGVYHISSQEKMFFQLQLFEIAIIALNSVFIGLEKSKGNSKGIFKLNIMVLIIKLSLTCIFVYGFGVKNIIWIEIATIIGQGALLIIGLFCLTNRNNIIRISLKEISLKWRYVKPILILAIPVMLGKVVMSLGKVIVNAMCANYYNAATDGLIVGALGVSNSLSGIVTGTTNAFEEGTSTIVSQNIGAKNMKRALKSFFRTLALVSVITVVGYVAVRFVFENQLISLFNNNKDAEKSQALQKYIKEVFKYDSISILSLGINSAVLGILYGFGKTGLASILNFSRIGTRILSLIICHKFLNVGYKAAGISMGISNVIILLVSLIFLAFFFVRTNKNGYKGLHFNDPEPEFNELTI